MTGAPHQAEAAAASEKERCHQAKQNLDVGATSAVFGSSVLLGCVLVEKEDKQPGNTRLTVSLLLAFATFLSGKLLMLLGLNLLAGRDRQPPVSGGQRVAAAKWLVAACAVLSVLTLLSLLSLLPGTIYLYIGLAVTTAIVVLSGAGSRALARLRGITGGGSETAMYDEGHKDKEELDAASKTTPCA